MFYFIKFHKNVYSVATVTFQKVRSFEKLSLNLKLQIKNKKV